MKDLAEECLLVCEADGYTVETIRQKRVLLNQFIRYCNQNGVEDVEEITSAFLRKWIIDEKKRCKANSINAKIQHIRPFFNWLIEEEIIEKNPWAKIKLLGDSMEATMTEIMVDLQEAYQGAMAKKKPNIKNFLRECVAANRDEIIKSLKNMH
ncbi:tyrosine-type recombinase/integrase [Bacillus sp. USDA818B3_A]|uniref:tyrosine-type recombinase/integrase n=1 Tax=Bacillus sp. USDA818B3_A TaxID=2698834 RepID=UPI00137054B4|nr:phage integrase SAM-like domain-containing protein [Bacillus sp. USDA818B3_A]